MSTQLDGYLSVREAAQLSGYSESYLRRLARGGVLDHTKVGTMIFFKPHVIETYTRDAKQSGSGRRGPRANP
jgi:excisionase family DNA binding protein